MGGRDSGRFSNHQGGQRVSTHAPVGGRDTLGSASPVCSYVSTHAPVGGRDPLLYDKHIIIPQFQLTRPWEGATEPLSLTMYGSRCFNSRARGRARPVRPGRVGIDNVVSTHAPVGGRDRMRQQRNRRPQGFNSRARGRARSFFHYEDRINRSFNSRARGRARLAISVFPSRGP